MNKEAKETTRQHLGPGKKAVNLYTDAELHERIQARAESLGISVSRYFAELAKKDLAEGGPVVLRPTNSPGVDAASRQENAEFRALVKAAARQAKRP